MTDYQILTIVVAAIIINVAVLSLVAIPLLRRATRAARRCAAAPAGTGPAEPVPSVSEGRLAAVIGASPSLSAALPVGAIGGHGIDDLPIGTLRAETDENGLPVGPSDVIDAVEAARAASDAGQGPLAATASHDAQEEAPETDMDLTELSAARARGYAIHPEDPLVASTIDRLLGARRDEPTEVPSSDAADAGGAATSVAEHDAGAGRPVMAAASSSGEGYPEPTIDAETGLDSPLAWSMAIAIEEARSSRYGRPVSVVIAELDGLDRLAELIGTDVADRLIPPVADALRRNARAADRVARLGHARFGVLLVETDEVRAINYVERVRSACDRWLEASAIALRLSIGWASPTTDGDLRSAVRMAEDRMYREQHRPAPWRPAATSTTTAPASSTPKTQA